MKNHACLIHKTNAEIIQPKALTLETHGVYSYIVIEDFIIEYLFNFTA